MPHIKSRPDYSYVWDLEFMQDMSRVGVPGSYAPPNIIDGSYAAHASKLPILPANNINEPHSSVRHQRPKMKSGFLVICETPKLYDGLGRSVEYPLIEYTVNMSMTF
jgi:hypothetical protein